MKNLILPLLLFASLIISCTKENPPIIEVPIVIPDTVTTPDTIINPYVKYTYEGNWRYTDYKIVQNVGIVQIDTTYPGILELNISSDTIKEIPDFHYLKKSDLIQDSMVWMRAFIYLKLGARIDLSIDEKEVKYLREIYSPQGGPSRFYFEGKRN
ncbi:MAG: hypothetical protein KBF79_14820 [Saprospiraceae bacterium]|jgi:hypothetical protein|nr:hypothetical protein [Saprospiraceae bacterium]